MSKSGLSSTEWTVLFALKMERGLIERLEPDGDQQIIRAWLDRRIRELEAKK